MKVKQLAQRETPAFGCNPHAQPRRMGHQEKTKSKTIWSEHWEGEVRLKR